MFLRKQPFVYLNIPYPILVLDQSDNRESQKCLNCRENTKTSSEVYVCNNCNFTIDRDILGSSNILVKNW